MESSTEEGIINVSQSLKREDRGGIGLIILLIVSAVGIIILTFIAQASVWLIQEAVFYGYKIPDLRWLILLGFSLGIIIPSAVLLALISNRFHKRIYRSLLFAGMYGLILTPVHFAGITSTQLSNVLQIGTSLIFMAGFIIWMRRGKMNLRDFLHRPSSSELLLGIAAAVVSGYFWLAWGAFGSILDTLLNLLAGLSLGAVTILILRFVLFEPILDNPQDFRWTDFLLFGFLSSLVFMSAATGFGHNGSQMLLLAALPWVGWPAAAYLGRAGSQARLWPPLALVGLAGAWPLMLIDPDELSSVINSGQGELFEFSIKAAAGTIFLGLVMIILSLVNPRRTGKAAAGLAALAIIGGACIFGLAGKPGLYGEKLFVILKTQSDLTPLMQMQPVEARRAKVYELLSAEADKSQADLRASLDKLNISYTPYYLVNGLEVNGGPVLKWWLETRPDVDRVLDSPHLRPLPEELPTPTGELSEPANIMWNLKMIKIDRVRDEFGVTGKGIIVGQSDSGVDGAHIELADSYRGRDGTNDYNWYDPWAGSTEPIDKNGHGTHTLGTILGNNVGIAPDAEWIGCANLQRNLGNPAVYLDCMQFMLAPFPQDGDPFKDGKPELGADVTNNSWGCPVVEGCDPGTFLQAVKALRTAGIFVVASTGNSGDGGCGSVTDPPAIYDEVLSVGAVNSNRQRTSFSSLGPVTVDGSNRVKPDIMAPGEDVLSAYPEGTYSKASGTSMAGPHLVGVVALMWSANPDLIGDIDRTNEILEKTASKMMDVSISCEDNTSYPNNETGFGIVDAFEAVKLALEN